MKKMVLLLCTFTIVMFVVILAGYIAPADALMTVDSECNLCHDGVVSKFPSAAVEKNIACNFCHYSSSHFVNVQTPYGWFQSAESPNTNPSNIHRIHGGNNTPATDSYCQKCHIRVSCNTCHGTPNHSSHGTSQYAPQSFTVASVVYGGTRTSVTTQPLSCATSQCHGTWENVLRKKTDGSDLCFNCHSTGLSGHGNLDVKHQTSFTSLLSSPTGPVMVNCNQCHKEQLNQEHLNKVNDCSNCHGSSVRADVQAVVASAKATTDPANDLLAKECFKCHADPPFKHQPTHAAIFDSITDTTSLHTNCNTCHANTTVATTVYSLANSNTGYSCLDCHNANLIKAPLHKAVFSGNNTEYNLPGMHENCATCHGNSKVIDTANNITVNATINSVAANKPATAYSCNECHSGTMQPRHSAAMTVNGAVYDTVAFHPSCTTCHDKTTNTNLSNEITQLMAGQGSYLCSDCHNNQVASTPKHQVGTGIGNNVVDSVGYHPDCTTCHANTAAQAKIKLLKQQSSYVCSDCHNGSVAPLANHQATLSQNNSTYSTPEMHPSCDTCHKSADLNVKTQIKGLIGQATYACEVCHTGSLQPRHQALQEAGGTLVETTGFHPSCTTCHGRQDLITTISTLKAKNPYMCYDCHNGQAARSPQHVAKLKSTDAQATATVGFHPTGCATCHNDTVGPKVNLAASNAGGYECGLCHDGSVAGTPSHTAQYELNGTLSDTTNIHPTCTTCHGNTTSKITNLQTVIGDLKTAVKAGQTSYQCSVCHGDINALHVSPSDLSSSLNMINCSWCHSKQLLDTHLKPVVKLNQAMSCETCHSNATPEGIKNAISFQMKGCDDCHNGASNAAPGIHPDSQYLPKHNGIFPEFTGITGYPSPDCKVCHNNGSGGEPNIAPYHMDMLNKFIGCKSCHSNNLAYKPAVVSQSTDCSGCHQATMEKTHVTFHTVADAVYNTVTPTATSAECLNCHALPGATLSTLLDVHKKRATSTVTCDTCHAETARIPVPAAIAANNKACETCHTNGGHQHNVAAFETDANLSKVTCANCHATDATTNSTELSKLHADRGFACATCHNDKFEVQNQIIVKDGAINVPVCSTCHNNTLAPSMDKYPPHSGTDTSHNSATAIGNYTFGGNVDCTSCHSSLANGSFALSPVHTKVTCDTCHSSSVANVKSVISNNMSRQAIKTTYTCADCHNSLPNKHLPEHKAISTEQVNCKNCHSFDATIAVATPDIHVTKGCDSCHGANVPQGIKDIVTPKVGQVNPVYNCENCHSQLPGGHNKNHVVNSYLTASTNTECAGCHGQDIAVLHSGNVGSKSLNCNSCHGDVLSATAPQNTKTIIATNLSTNAARTGFSCDSCHISVQDGGHKHPVSSFATSPQVDCAQCHTTDAAAKTTDLAQLHAAKNIGCASCHNTTFEGGANPVIVRDGVVNVPTCAACHDGIKAPQAETAYPDHNSTITTTHTSAANYGTYALAGSVNCAGCHTTLNIRPVHQTVDCNKCHTSTTAAVQSVISGNWSRQTTKAPYSCADCHNAVTTAATTKHQPVHTAGSFTLDTTDVENCTTCHSTKVLTDLHVGKTNKAGAAMTCDSCHNSADTKVMTLISQQARSATPTYSCDSCHTLHGNGDHTVTIPVGLTAEPSLKCAQCHDNDPATAGVTDLASEHTKRVNAVTGQNYTCDICHNSTKTEVKNAIATKNKTCSACHTAGWHSDLTTPHSSTYVTNPAFQCANCHGNVLSNKTLHPDAVAGTITVGGGPVSYKLYRGTDGVSFTEIATSAVNTFSDTGLTTNTQYYYQAAAVDQAGNVSTKSNVAFATAAVQQTTSTLNPTAAAYSSQSNNGDTSTDGGFSSLSPSVLTRLTDGRDSAGGSYDVRVQENGSSDRWIYVRIANDAKDDTKVVLDVRASWRYQDSSGNLLIYPYQSNGTSINTAAVVNYQLSNPSYNGNFTTYSIDVTSAAHTMDNFGFMKFRIKPGTDGSVQNAYISEADYQLTTGTAGASGTSTGNPGTAVITGTGGDNTPPSTPASLTAQGISTSQIDLTWTASTDPSQTVNQPGQSNCLKCHDSTQPNIMTAIITQKTNCDACHTVHGDPNVLHNTTFVLNPTMACATCHQSRVDNEHLSRKSPTTGLQYTCDTCHKSTDPLVQGAITNNDTKCSSCHPTRHTNVQSVHVSNYIPDTTVDCAGCHTATKSEFTSSSNKALHEITGTNSLATDGTYVSGYTKTSTLDCRGCHSVTNGTYFGRILVKPYTSSTGNSSTTGDLCFLCHDFRAYGTGGSYTAEAYSGFSLADSRMNLHVIGDHKGGCQLCHSTKPHAQSNREHFIVLKGEPNAGTTAQLTKFIHRTNKAYTKNSCSAGCGSGDHP